MRNQNGAVVLDTPAGRYSPDFAILIETPTSRILLEVKGDHLAAAAEGEARIKQKAARLWCDIVTKETKILWEYWFLMDSDAAHCNTWQDIENKADRPPH